MIKRLRDGETAHCSRREPHARHLWDERPTIACPGSTSRPLSELSDSGLLWLINASVFHPRGFALALTRNTETGEVTGWELLGNGSEPWVFAGEKPERFGAAEETFETARGQVP